MKQLLITTTDTLHGWEIETYIKPIFASVVIGANAFADISASFTDLFGGRSGSYEKRLQLIKDNAMAILNTKAKELGANCILGLSIDMDEISGKNTQMFMVTASGTAVIARHLKSQGNYLNSREIDKDNVNEKAQLIQLSKKFAEENAKISIEELQTIVDSKSPAFIEVAFRKLKALTSTAYSGSGIDQDEYQKALKLYYDYFGNIEPDDAIPLLYNGLLTETNNNFKDALTKIIRQNLLIDYSFIHKLLDADLYQKKTALNILRSDKPTYTSTDINEIQQIIDHIANGFPKVAKRSTKKGFLSSAEKEVWVCICGESNEMDRKSCFKCERDEYGFKTDESKPKHYIDYLTNKLEALKSLL